MECSMLDIKTILSEEKSISNIRQRISEMTDTPFEVYEENGSFFVKFQEKQEEIKENLQLLEG